MTETSEKQEKEILVGIAGEDAEEALSSLMELEELAGTAGAKVLEIFIQSRDLPHPGTYLGSGRLAELKERVRDCQ